jgi:hypothetical protein
VFRATTLIIVVLFVVGFRLEPPLVGIVGDVS